MITRRNFLSKELAVGAVDPYLSMDALLANRYRANKLSYVSVIPDYGNASKIPVPEGHRVAFGYDYFSLDTSADGLVLRCPDLVSDFDGDAYLRLQVAIDTREEDEIEVYLNNTDRKIGHLSIWYPTGLQLFETKLDCDITSIKKAGIRLKSNGTKPIFFLTSTTNNGSHMLLDDSKGVYEEERWINALCSYRSVQPFGWTEGCGLDGLQELYARGKDKCALKAIQQHLDLYLVDDQNLIYVDLKSRPQDNTFGNLEAGLPFAIIGQHRPHHASLNLFIDFCKARFDTNGNFIPESLSTEGCYTLAFPLAVLGRELKRPELYELALLEIEQRVAQLTDEEAVYNTWTKKEGKTDIRRNWGRGFVWFLLGIVKTVEILQQDRAYRETPRIVRLRETFQYYANIALSHQQPDYSWCAYLDQPETKFESSATAGLAAAFAHGHRMGWLPSFSGNQLRNIYQRLLDDLTSDGFLRSVTQRNAGSIELLQKGTYRVIAQYALGFMAQIKVHLDQIN